MASLAQPSTAQVADSPRQETAGTSPPPGTELPVASSPFDGERAYAVLKEVVELGPRISASKAMKDQRAMLTKHFESLGAKVYPHTFKYRPPSKGPGRSYPITNLIVSWNPAAQRRILLCTHYDTRPFADQDPVDKRAELPGANDGASGVALLHELGRHMEEFKDAGIGVDFVFFDAEEFVYNNRQTAGEGADPLFVGSTQFAHDYQTGQTSGKLGYVYECGVLLDMIGDAELELYWEKNSMDAAPNLVKEIWAVAQRLGYPQFHPEIKHEVRDDHLPLNAVARIPTINIIDFDYPNVGRSNEYWHTQQDTVDKCSPESIAIVGHVVLEWLGQRVLNK